MAEMTNLKAAYEVSPVLAGFLGAGVLVVSVTVAVFLWTYCQRRYRQLSGGYKLQSGLCDPPVDPPYKFIHMLKGISIYPDLLSNKKIVRVGRRAGPCGGGVSGGRCAHGDGGERGRGRPALVDADPEVGSFNSSLHPPAYGQPRPERAPPLQPRPERAPPLRADYCCLDNGCDASRSASSFPPAEGSDAPLPSLGTLILAVDYSFPKKALVVTVVGARGLLPVDRQAGSAAPYVKMTILPDKKHRVKTRVLRKTLEPVFDETFTFYGIAYSSLAELTLHFLVLSFDRYARDDVIGEAAVPLAGLDPSTGPVHISQNITKRHIQNVSRGELLVSLSYQPQTQRLHLLVMKAKHLPSMDLTGLSGNPYVKVNVYYGRKRIAKKRTQVKRCTLSPVFNQSFVLEVASELLADVSVEFLVVDFDRTAKNQVLGRLLLGGQSPTPMGISHWREVCDNPRRQIAKWHNLDEF